MNAPAKITTPEQYAWLAMKHLTDAVLIMTPDQQVVWVNEGFLRLYGYQVPDFGDDPPQSLLLASDHDPETQVQVEQAMTEMRPIQVEIRKKDRDGNAFWVEKRVFPVFDGSGQHIHFMSIARDITNRRDMEQAAREASENEDLRQQERKLLGQVSEWLYSAKSIEELLLVIAKALETLFPEAEGQLFIYSNSRDSLELRTHWGGAKPEPRHTQPDDCWALRRGRAYAYGMRPIEFPCGHVHEGETDDPYFCIPITAHGQTNGLLHLRFGLVAPDRASRAPFKTFLDQRWELALLCAEQISLAIANVQLRQELLDQSVRDPLTNLWNRRWFLDAAHRAANKAKSSKAQFSVISIDVDHFKTFNDHHGHDAGDMVLRALGARMIEFFTNRCSPCRIGGEEFIVLCADMDEKEAWDIAEEFRDEVRDISIKYGESELPTITISAGIAAWPNGGGGVEDLVKAADLALYDAKDLGRDRVVAFSERSSDG